MSGHRDRPRNRFGQFCRPGGGHGGPGRSPDRADAMVRAMTELMLGRKRAEPRIRLL